MKHVLPHWPNSIPRTYNPVARLLNCPILAPYRHVDALAIAHARRLRRETETNSFTTGTAAELMWANTAAGNTLGTFTSEASLLGGLNDAPTIPALYFFNKSGFLRTVSIVARGVLSTTSTPTFLFTVRLNPSFSATPGGTLVGITNAITCGSGVTNALWELRLDLTCLTPGIGSGNTTLSGAGYVFGPGSSAASAFSSPFIYTIEPSTPPTATWTSTIDCSVTQYVQMTATCGTSSSSNTITLKQLYLYGMN